MAPSSSAIDSSSVDVTTLSTDTEHQHTNDITAKLPVVTIGASTKPLVDANGASTKLPEQREAQPGVSSAASDQAVGIDQAVLEENERLRREVARLRAQEERRRQPGQARRVLVGVLIFLSCLGILSSTLTLWSSSTLLNTNTWIQIVGPVGHNPQVVQAVSAYTASEVVTLLNVQRRATQVLPPKATFLAAPLTQVVQNFTQARIATLMHRPAFQQIWISTNRYVYSELLAALRGQSSTLYISNGVVTLNLVPIIDQGLQDIQQHLPTLIAQHVKLPDPSQLQVPQQAQQKLSQALGIPVPTNLGQIELYQSAQLAKAQRLFGLWQTLTWVLPLATAVLIILTLWFSTNRRRTLLQLGIGIAIGFILLKFAIDYLQQYIINATMNPTAKSVVQPILRTVFGGLDSITTWLMVGGVVLAVVAYVAGKSEWFAALRERVRAGYQWFTGKIEELRNRPPQAAAGAA